jgi:phosphoribosylglycinamide formyltransferase-1
MAGPESTRDTRPEQRSAPESPLRLGVLFSGGGRTLENLELRIRQGALPAKVVLAISSHARAKGIDRAGALDIPVEILDYRERGDALSSDITAALEAAGVDLVVLAGFIRHYDFPPHLAGRIVNIHPALLPAFGGKGFYGARVHEAVLRSGVQFSGCTVHFVTEDYDSGPIILQRVVPVFPDDSPDELAARIFVEECEAYPEAIRLYAEGRLQIRDGKVLVKAPERTSEPIP